MAKSLKTYSYKGKQIYKKYGPLPGEPKSTPRTFYEVEGLPWPNHFLTLTAAKGFLTRGRKRRSPRR